LSDDLEANDERPCLHCLIDWQPVLDQRIGQHVTGVVRNGIEWDFGRKLGLGL